MVTEGGFILPGVSPFEALAVSVPQRPLLPSWLTVVDLEEGRIQFRGENFLYTLHHPVLCGAFRTIHELLDGTRSSGEVIVVGGEKFLPTTIELVLRILRANCVLFDAETIREIAPQALHTFSLLGHYLSDADVIAMRLSSVSLPVIGEPLLCSAVVNALQGWGIRATTPDTVVRMAFDKTPLVLVCGRFNSRRLFNKANEAGLATGVRWMRIAMEGTLPVVGPTFIPWQSACFQCLEDRTLGHATILTDEQHYRSSNNDERLDVPTALLDFLAAHAALEVVRLLTGFAPPTTVGRFLTLPMASSQITGHDVLRMPRCPACRPQSPPRSPWDAEMLIDPVGVNW